MKHALFETSWTAVTRWAAIALMIAGCSHTPPKPLDPQTTDQLTHQFHELLAKELLSKPDLKQIRSIEIQKIGPVEDGLLKVDYHVSFESDSAPMGDVDHDFSGTATLVQKSENHWEIQSLDRKSQGLIFHQSETVTSEGK